MAIGISVAVRNARLQAVLDEIDAGSAGGYIEFYDGTQPVTGGTVTTLLGTVTFATTAGTITGGVLTFDTITDDTSADATGTVTWCRFYDSDANHILDGDCGNTASTALVKFDNPALVAGGTIHIASGILTEGNP